MSIQNQAMTDLIRYDSALLPSVRSTFDKSHSHTTTFDSGVLVPLMCDRVLPGDEKKIIYNGLARMATPIHPVMDQAVMDVWCFYVPDRLWYFHAKEFYGENKDAEFNPDGEYVLPYLKPSQYCVLNEPNLERGIGSLNDYFGFPVCNADAYARDDDPRNYVSAGLHRCYQLIWNEWFRNSSIQPSLQLNDGDTVTEEEWNTLCQLRYVNRYPDYFTTALKDPQSGPDVLLPLSDYIPVFTREDEVPLDLNEHALSFRVPSSPNTVFNESVIGIYQNELFPMNVSSQIQADTDVSLAPSNLWAHLTNERISTITNLRAAITAQHLFELRNSAGKRYQQILYATWGVLTGDSTLQRPQLIGTTGKNYLGMRQVVQTSATDENSPLGNVAAFSLTQITNKMICNQSFTEPGIIMVLGAIRPVISYSQGINCLWTQLTPFEQYQPVFDGLSNQPIYNYEIFASQNADPDKLHDVFGYKPAWDEYRTMQNRVSGLMRPDVTGTLSSWNYSVAFDSQPLLDDAFIQVDPDLIDRVIATPDEPQFICDSYFKYYDTRSMSVHGTPGIDMI